MPEKRKCTIVPFRPRAELEAKRQLREFIDHAKNKLDLFGKDLDWESNPWGTNGLQKKKGSNSQSTINFTAIGSTRWKSKPMSKPFVDFAKAYIRYDLTMAWKVKADSHLTGLKVLEAALIRTSTDGLADVTKTDAHVMDVGADIIREYYKGEAQYQAAWRLVVLSEFLSENDLVESPFTWVNPFQVPTGGRKVGKKHDAAIKEKLPAREALEALVQIFFAATDRRDILVTSMACILASGPSRASEVVHCQNNVEVWLDNPDGTKDLALEWYPAKGGEDGAKPIPKDFEPVVVRALELSRSITDEGRKIARWYEDHPDKMYMPKELSHLRNQKWLKAGEVAQIFGWKHYTKASIYMDKWNITFREEDRTFPGRKGKDGKQCKTHRKLKEYLFADVEQKVLSFIPSDFPWLDEANGIKYSNALFVIPKGLTNPQRGTSPCMFEACTYSTVHRQIGIADRNNIFARYGYTMPDGSPMTILTQQIRHWLNTLAERGGMTDFERDFWSGRKPGAANSGTTRASRAYLHNTLEEYVKAAGMDIEVLDQNPFATAIAKRPVSLDEFHEQDEKPTIHATEYGVCFHDFAQDPCSTHADCLNCMEHACVKGDEEKTERIRKIHDLYIEQLEAARVAIDEEYCNADQWHLSHSLSLKRTEALLKLLDNPELPDDTIIMLKNPFQYSAFRNAVQHRAEKLGDVAALEIAKALEVPPMPLPSEK